MAIDTLTGAAPQAPTFTPASESPNFDERWAAWQARGAARERAFHRRMVVLAPVVVGLAAIVYLLLGR
jgi:hypothetical protein